MSVEAPRVSILLLTKNAGKFLGRQLEAIRGQGVSGPVEIIAVDSGSKDGTLDVLRSEGVRIIEIAPESFDHGLTRNIAAENSTGDLLVYLTQDAIPADINWLPSLVETVRNSPDIAAAFSRQVPPPSCRPSLARQMTEDWPQIGGGTRIFKRLTNGCSQSMSTADLYLFSNTSSCIVRSVWERIPFEKSPFGEDTGWAKKVLSQGFSIVYEPSSSVIHAHDNGLKARFQENFDYGRMISAFGLSRGPGFSLIKEYIGYIKKDLDYIARSGLRRAKILSSLAWHFSGFAGRFLGESEKNMPHFLIKALSRQEKIKAQ